MIFITIETEKTVQVEDKTRIDISKTFISGDTATIDLYEIDPDNSGTFYDVTSDMYLDWKYDTNADKTVIARVTDSDTNIVTKESTITVLNETEDNLFSIDKDIIGYEPQLLEWVQAGRDSFLDKHRLAQIEILNELDAKKIWKRDGTRYVAADIVDIQEFKEWSKFLTLQIIFDGISNDVGDVFRVKADSYRSHAQASASRAALRLDYNQDGELDNNEYTDTQSGTLVRR